MSVLKLIILLLGIYFLYKFIVGFLIPVIRAVWKVKQFQKQAGEQYQQQQRQQQNGHGPRREGETIIEHIPPDGHGKKKFTKSKPPPKSGDEEYIDYEEVK